MRQLSRKLFVRLKNLLLAIGNWVAEYLSRKTKLILPAHSPRTSLWLRAMNTMKHWYRKPWGYSRDKSYLRSSVQCKWAMFSASDSIVSCMSSLMTCTLCSVLTSWESWTIILFRNNGWNQLKWMSQNPHNECKCLYIIKDANHVLNICQL